MKYVFIAACAAIVASAFRVNYDESAYRTTFEGRTLIVSQANKTITDITGFPICSTITFQTKKGLGSGTRCASGVGIAVGPHDTKDIHKRAWHLYLG